MRNLVIFVSSFFISNNLIAASYQYKIFESDAFVNGKLSSLQVKTALDQLSRSVLKVKEFSKNKKLKFQKDLIVFSMAKPVYPNLYKNIDLKVIWNKYLENKKSRELIDSEMTTISDIFKLNRQNEFIEIFQPYYDIFNSYKDREDFKELDLLNCYQLSTYRMTDKYENCVGNLQKKFKEDLLFQQAILSQMTDYYLKVEEYEKAELLLKEIETRFANNTFVLRNEVYRSRVLVGKNKFDKGLDLLKKVQQEIIPDVKINRDFYASVTARKAYMLMSVNRLKEAKAEIEKLNSIYDGKVKDESFYGNLITNSVFNFLSGDAKAAQNKICKAVNSLDYQTYTNKLFMLTLSLVYKKYINIRDKTTEENRFFREAKAKNEKYKSNEIIKSEIEIGLLLSDENLSIVDLEKTYSKYKEIVNHYQPKITVLDVLMNKLKKDQVELRAKTNK